MKPYLQISNLCISCDNCRLLCPENCIMINNKQYFIESWSCTQCQVCIEVCPVDCIRLIENQADTLST